MNQETKQRLRRIPLLATVYRNLRKVPAMAGFLLDFTRYRKLARGTRARFSLAVSDWEPSLTDRTPVTTFDRHYVYHPAWAARIIAETRPAHHVDISSSLNFCAMVSAFVPVTFYDYRPAELNLSNLTSSPADLMALPFADNSIASLSCMHVVEHVGLGRYGDPLDPDGDLKAIAELMRVLAPGGTLLFVVPVGRPRIMFNAHRIYSYEQVVEYFAGLTLAEFALIPDGGELLRQAEPALVAQQGYGCGCFWFRKPGL